MTDGSSDHPSRTDAADTRVRARAHRSGVPADEPKSVTARQPGSSVADGSETMWFLSNRYNLLEILSSGLIAPRSSYEKYYADLLADTGEAVVLLRRPPGALVRERVLHEGGNNFPVLMELPARGLVGQSRDLEGLSLRRGAIPFHHVRAVHFPDERSLRDHGARRFDNVPSPADRFRVSASLFPQGDPDADGRLLEVLGQARSDWAGTDWRVVDRVRGALSAALAALSMDVPPHLVAEMLCGIGRSPEDPVHGAPDPAIADEILRSAILRVFGRTDPDRSWAPRALLREITQSASTSAGPQLSDQIGQNLDLVRRVVSGDQEFAPFKETTRGLPAAKSLLLALLRPELPRVLTWSWEETNAGPSTMLLAAVMIGYLRGVTRQPTDLRNTVLDEHTAAWAAEVSGHGTWTAPDLQVLVHAHDAGTSLLLGDLELATHPLGTAVRDDFWKDVPSGLRARLEVRLAHVLAPWAVVSNLRLPRTASILREQDEIIVRVKGPVLHEETVDEAALLEAIDAAPEKAAVLRRALLDELGTDPAGVVRTTPEGNGPTLGAEPEGKGAVSHTRGQRRPHPVD